MSEAASLVVASPAAAALRLLAPLDAVVTALTTEDGAPDEDAVARILRARSAMILSECRVAPDQLGRRTFAKESMVATFLATDRRSDTLVLPWRVPVRTITSVVEAGVTLAATDYAAMPNAALLRRLSGGAPAPWSCGQIVVTYEAGFDVTEDLETTGLPPELVEACIAECRVAWFAEGRDPTAAAEAMPDVYSTTYRAGSTGAEREGLLGDTKTLVRPWRAAM